ncbi:MAG TPA: hypothetical protein VI033_03535 [Candidatus Nitrosopolaris sp.]
MIAITYENKQRLRVLGVAGMSYNDVLSELLQQNDANKSKLIGTPELGGSKYLSAGVGSKTSPSGDRSAK